MDDCEITAIVLETISKEMSVEQDDLSKDMGPEEIPNWDSMSHVSLTSELESRFGISFEIDEIMEMENIGAIVSILKRKLS